jgi:hypothetical protein
MRFLGTIFLSSNLLQYNWFHCPVLLSNLGFHFHIQHCYGFQTIKMWRSKVTYILKAQIFWGMALCLWVTSNQFSTCQEIMLPSYSESSRIWPLRWGQHNPLNLQELLTLQHNVTLHKTWTFSNTTARNPYVTSPFISLTVFLCIWIHLLLFTSNVSFIERSILLDTCTDHILMFLFIAGLYLNAQYRKTGWICYRTRRLQNYNL